MQTGEMVKFQDFLGITKTLILRKINLYSLNVAISEQVVAYFCNIEPLLLKHLTI